MTGGMITLPALLNHARTVELRIFKLRRGSYFPASRAGWPRTLHDPGNDGGT